MILKKTCVLLLIGLWNVTSQAQNEELIILKNDFLERQFVVKDGAFFTNSYKNLLTGKDYSRYGSEEFFFSVDGKAVAGAGSSASFNYERHSIQEIENGIRQLTVDLKGRSGGPAQMLYIKLIYWLYDDFPVVRKQLQITNRRPEAVPIENLEVERLNLVPINTQQT